MTFIPPEFADGVPLKGVGTEHIREKAIYGYHLQNGLILPIHFDSSVFGVVGDISTINPDDLASAGATGRVADANHQHRYIAEVPVGVGVTLAEGTGGANVRDDHQHDINVHCVKAVWSANTAVATDTNVAIAFGGTDEYDVGGLHNPASNNTRITFQAAGVYDVGGWYVMAPDIDGARGIYIQKTLAGGGTSIIAQKKITTAVFGGAPNDAMEISVHAKFAVNDYVELFAQNIASGATLNVTNGAFYACYKSRG